MNCVVISCLFVVVSSPANNGMSYMNDSSSENASETLMDKFNKEIFSYLIQFFQAHVLRPVKGNTLYCLPQDCSLVGNPEVGNFVKGGQHHCFNIFLH